MTKKKPRYNEDGYDEDGYHVLTNITRKFEEMEDSCLPSGGGAEFQWTAKGRGWGQFYFYTDKDGKFHCDSETMNKEFVKIMLCKMVDDAEFHDYSNFPGKEED